MIYLLRYWQLIAGAVGCLILGIMLLSARSDARHFKKLHEAEKAAHVQTVTNYRVAQAEAVKLDAANKARVEQEQNAISERITDDYEKRIAAVRARFSSLRRAPATNPSGGGAAPVPSTGPATRGADGAASEAGLPPEDALIATEQAIQLQALQEWVKAQARVEN